MDIYPIGKRARIGRDGRTYAGIIVEHSTTREGAPVVVIEYRIPGGGTRKCRGIVGLDTIRVLP
jgi:hypothetical protein